MHTNEQVDKIRTRTMFLEEFQAISITWKNGGNGRLFRCILFI